MLTGDEQQRLREIEQWFEAHDPELAEYVRTGRTSHSTASAVRRPARARVATLCAAMAVVGCLLLWCGVVLDEPGVIFAGLSGALGGGAVRSWLR